MPNRCHSISNSRRTAENALCSAIFFFAGLTPTLSVILPFSVNLTALLIRFMRTWRSFRTSVSILRGRSAFSQIPDSGPFEWPAGASSLRSPRKLWRSKLTGPAYLASLDLGKSDTSFDEFQQVRPGCELRISGSPGVRGENRHRAPSTGQSRECC